MIQVADVLRMLDQVVDAAIEQWGEGFRYSDRYPADSNVCSYVAAPTKQAPDWEPQYDGEEIPMNLLNDDERWVTQGPLECSCLVAKMFEPTIDPDSIEVWTAISTIRQDRERPLDFPDVSESAMMLLEQIQDLQDADFPWSMVRQQAHSPTAVFAFDDEPFPFKEAA